MGGFSDNDQDEIGDEHEKFVPASGGGLTATLQVGPGGRVVIPAEMRDAMGLRQGDSIFANFENGELKLQSYAAAIAEVQSFFREINPEGHRWSDELIADRRAEVAKEEREDAEREEWLKKNG